MFLLLACTNQRRGQLKPLRTPESAGLMFVSEPILVTFADIQADPTQFHNQIIRVQGSFTLLPPAPCQPYKGPQLRWALIAAGLRMDALRLEQLRTMIPEGTILTVEGVWRLYHMCWFSDSPPIWESNPRPVINPNFIGSNRPI